MNQEYKSERVITYAQAISEATDQALELDPNFFVIGQGTRGAGYIFGTLHELYEKYGSERIIEMPMSEAAMTGVCMGAALNNIRAMLILQRADFLYLILDQLINHASKWHYMFGGASKVPIVIRCIVGKGWGQGPQHSQSLHSLCSHFPGLRVVAPSQASQAKGLLLNSIFSDDPVVFFEGRPLHFQKDTVPEEPYLIPFGKSQLIHQGTDLTVLNCSFSFREVTEAIKILERKGVSAEFIELVSISPVDYQSILQSVEKTKRLLIVDTSWKECGISSTIAAHVSKTLFNKLKAPVEILTVPFYPAPAASNLEADYYPSVEKIVDFSIKTLNYQI